MKKISILLLLSLFIACGVKQSTHYLNSGNYDEAISIAVNSLQNNKNAKEFSIKRETDLRDVSSINNVIKKG